jgi:hypothetical protein
VYQHDPPGASARWLCGHVFGDSQGHMVTFTGRQVRLERQDAPANQLTQTRQRSFPYPASVEEAIAYLMRESKRGRDAYFGVHLFREAGTRLASKTLGALSCLWLDEDDGHFPGDGPEPTAVVHSSGRRRHLYWRLSHPVSAEWVVGMNRRIAAWAGGDSGKAGLASVLRVPGTLNFKRAPQIDPVVGELTGIPPWDPEVLEQAIPELLDPASPPSTEPYDGPRIELLDFLNEVRVEVITEVPDDLGVKLGITCPWVGEHSGGDPSGTYVGQLSNGALWFHCHHEHCQGRGWTEFKRGCRRREAREVRLAAPLPTDELRKVVIRLD